MDDWLEWRSRWGTKGASRMARYQRVRVYPTTPGKNNNNGYDTMRSAYRGEGKVVYDCWWSLKPASRRTETLPHEWAFMG